MAKKPLFLALIAIATVAVVVPMVLFGLPYGRFNPEAFAHLYTLVPPGNETHLHIDANPANGSRPCDPLDSEAVVGVGKTHTVAVCLETYGPNSVNNFELHIRYTGDPSAKPAATTINLAPTVACGAGTADPYCLDANPDANDTKAPDTNDPNYLGSGWDCSGFGMAPPVGDDPNTLNVADAFIACYANLGTPDQDLAADPGLLATISFTATDAGDDLIDFGDVDASNSNIIYSPRLPTPGVARCGTAVPAEQVACFGAVIHKVVFDCEFNDDHGNGTSLATYGNGWQFTFPWGVANGTGHVVRFGSRVLVVGRAAGINVIGFGTCPTTDPTDPGGPGTFIAIDVNTSPPSILILQDTTPAHIVK